MEYMFQQKVQVKVMMLEKKFGYRLTQREALITKHE